MLARCAFDVMPGNGLLQKEEACTPPTPSWFLEKKQHIRWIHHAFFTINHHSELEKGLRSSSLKIFRLHTRIKWLENESWEKRAKRKDSASLAHIEKLTWFALISSRCKAGAFLHAPDKSYSVRGPLSTRTPHIHQRFMMVGEANFFSFPPPLLLH